jgi:hypothetical protein
MLADGADITGFRKGSFSSSIRRIGRESGKKFFGGDPEKRIYWIPKNFYVASLSKVDSDFMSGRRGSFIWVTFGDARFSLLQCTKMGGKVHTPNDNEIYEMYQITTKYTAWPRSSKIYQSWYFWYANMYTIWQPGLHSVFFYRDTSSTLTLVDQQNITYMFVVAELWMLIWTMPGILTHELLCKLPLSVATWRSYFGGLPWQRGQEVSVSAFGT